MSDYEDEFMCDKAKDSSDSDYSEDSDLVNEYHHSMALAEAASAQKLCNEHSKELQKFSLC
mgnify:CR=1 FL=1